MAGGIPSGSDPAGYDPWPFSIVGSMVSGMQTRNEGNVRAQLTSDVQNNDTLNTMSGKVFSGINPALGLVAGTIEAMLRRMIGQIPIIGPDAEAWVGNLLDQLGTYYENLGGLLGDLNFMDPNFNPQQAIHSFIELMLLPTQLIPAMVNGFISAAIVPALDASKIVSGFIADNVNPVVQQLLAGLTGLFGIPASSAAVGGAVASQTDTLAAISAAVAKLEAQFADNDPTTVLVEDAFEYTNITGPDPALWTVVDFTQNSGGALNQGHVEADGHQIVWVSDGSGNHGKRFFYTGPDSVSTKDSFTTKVVVGSSTMPTMTNQAWWGIICRANAAKTIFVELRIYVNTIELYAVNTVTNTETKIGATQSLVGGAPGVGAIISIECGPTAGARYFNVTINTNNYVFFDSTNASQLGANYRIRGFTMFAGQDVFAFVTNQRPCGPIAHWASQNVA